MFSKSAVSVMSHCHTQYLSLTQDLDSERLELFSKLEGHGVCRRRSFNDTPRLLTYKYFVSLVTS